ncbi:MAG: CoB--CoM heterodisulfide reductase iron-sulfur subunit A family protein [Nitrososphaerota archaeon]
MSKPVLVIGGGIAGIQAALDLADQGIQVYLVEKSPSIGGRMAQLDKTFPTLDCASCILTPKMVSVARHNNIKLLTYSEVIEVSGRAGDFNVKILKKPRYVEEENCIGCGECVAKCPSRVPDEFNLKMSNRKAIYFPFPQAVPLKATIDKEHCLFFTKGVCRVCERFCPTKAINFEQQPKIIELNVAAIIIATGYDFIDPSLAPLYGYGKYQNVYTSLEFERLVSSTGPTNGEIIRRSDGKHPKSIAFIQCVCSRDVKINPNCSAFCCMASVKEAILAKEHLGDVDCTIFYMDLRAFGKGYQEFYKRAMEEFNIKFIKAKPAKIEEKPETKNLLITYEEQVTGVKRVLEVDMVVLAVGVKPVYPEAISLEKNEDGWVKLRNPYLDPVSTSIEGVYIIGVAAGAKDIPDSVTQAGAAAVKASILAWGGG